MWGDERLMQPIAFDHCRVLAAREDQAIVRAQQEGLGYTPQEAVTGNDCLLLPSR
jgi:hypothetical protein